MNSKKVIAIVLALLILCLNTNSQITRGFKESTTQSTIATQGKYYALFIANQDYSDRSIPQLSEPYNDAVRIKTILTEKYNFEITGIKILKNPKRADFYAEFEKLSQIVTENDNVLIFYAGHGSFDEKRKQGYWWPSDAEKNNQANWISNGDIRDQLKGINAKHTLLISDACFSGGIFRTRGALPNANYAIEELVKKPSRRAITSGTVNEVPDKSVFVDYLVKRLIENKDQYISAQNLFVSFQEAVTNNSPIHQLPQYGVIQEVGDEGGDFVFYRPTEYRLPTSVFLKTSVPDADVFIDGQFIGKATPELKIDETQSGNKLIEVKKYGFAVYSKRIDIVDAKYNRFDVILEPLRYSNLIISSAIPAKVFINDKLYGDVRNQLKVPELAFGKYDIKLIAEGYKPFTQTVILSEYGDVDLSADLKPFTASIRFFGTIRADAFMDGDFITDTPIERLEVPLGEHSIVVKKSGYDVYEQKIFANSDKLITIPYKLTKKTPSSALSRSLMFPGFGQMYNERYVVGYAWAGAFVLSVGNLINRQIKYNDRVAIFNTAANEYLNEKNISIIAQKKAALLDAETIRDDVTTKRNVWIGVVAGIYLLNIADVFFSDPAFEKETFSLQINRDTQMIMASAVIKF